MSSLRGKLVRNFSWEICGSITRLLISLAVSVLTARYLGPGNYGLLNYVTSFAGFFSSFCNLGINAILVKELLDRKEDQGTVLGSTLTLRTVSTLLCMVANCVLIGVLNPGEPLLLSLAIIHSFSMLFSVVDSVKFWFQARLETKIPVIASTAGYVVVAAYRVVLLATGKSVAWFAAATTLDFAVVAMFLLLSYRKYKGPAFHFSLKVGKDIFSRSRHFILAGLMVSLYAQMDKVMLKSMIDTASVGFYTTANSVNGMWTFVVAALIDAVSPAVYQSYTESREIFKKNLKRLYAGVIFICLLAGICICLLAKPIVMILYSEEYMASISVLRVLVWSSMFSYLGVAKNIWIVSEKKNHYLVAFTAVGVVGNLILNWLLIPQYGAIGAAVATVITQFITSVLAQLIFPQTRENVIWMLEAFVFKDVITQQELKQLLETVKRKLFKQKDGGGKQE